MADERYRVTTATGRAELREKGSRFVARVEPAADEAAAAEGLARIQREFPDATHHCWARRIGQPARERWADAGEPNGTAGMPMLQVLRGAELSDTLAVVARWFGGTKLGKGGLARAYAGAVREALAAATTGERLRLDRLDLALPYARFGDLQRLVHPPEVELGAARYGETVRCTLRVLPSRRPRVEEELAALGIRVRSMGE